MDQSVSRVGNAAGLQIGTGFAQRSSSSMKSIYLNITFLKLLYNAHERGGRNVQSSSGKARFLSNPISWRFKLCEKF